MGNGKQNHVEKLYKCTLALGPVHKRCVDSENSISGISDIAGKINVVSVNEIGI